MSEAQVGVDGETWGWGRRDALAEIAAPEVGATWADEELLIRHRLFPTFRFYRRIPENDKSIVCEAM